VKKFLQNIPDLHKFVVGNRLAKIAGAQLICHIPVRRRVRRSDDENRKIPAFTAGPNSAEHFQSVDLRKIQIEQQNMWTWRVWISFGRGNKLDRAFAVRSNVNFQRQIFHSDSFPHQ
jgi:hypothetical protein